MPNTDEKTTEKKLSFKKRVNPKSSSIRGLIYYKTPNPFAVGPSGGNCTWYAWGRFWEVWAQGDSRYKTKMPKTVCRQNACYFFSDGKKNGFATGLKPRPGAIVCWGYNGAGHGNPGHVAFVEEVYANGDIEISQSGYSSGNMANRVIKKGTGKAGSGYKFGYANDYFNGFIYNPIDFGAPKGSVGGGDNSGDGYDMVAATSVLYSSERGEGYKWDYINYEDDPESAANKLKNKTQRLQDYLNDYYDNLKRNGNKLYEITGAISDVAADVILGAGEALENYSEDFLKLQNNFSIGSNVVEAPFVELDIEGYIIGTYNGSIDRYPNYISSLSVKKINGEINLYTINLVHQIRAGDDPNALDKLFSKVRYNKIAIRYGDCNAGAIFRDSNAIITNIASKRDYVNNRINYTISATSAGQMVSSYVTNFPTRVARPSNVIRDLFYKNPETSPLLLEAFPGMKDQTRVEALGLIPNDDIELEIDSQNMINPIEYLNYLVSCMSSQTNAAGTVIRDSVYYIAYLDNEENELEGPYIRISKVGANHRYSKYNTASIFSLTVGYPDDNFVLGFNVSSDQAWSLLYENAHVSSEHVYNIDNQGAVQKQYSPNISKASNIMNEIEKNWWTQMTQFPVNATIKLKGLLKPVMLTDYVDLNVVFYGQKHHVSGMYVITGQTDDLSGNGFSTTLSLVRVGDNN